MDFNKQYSTYVDIIETELNHLLPEQNVPEGILYKAMRYSLLSGGKRIRPVLSLAVCDMLNGNIFDVIDFACSIEMIHTYSLIHDDLPAMDNDDYRRGKPSNHKVFGEAAAILAGDGLLNTAFEVMSRAVIKMSEKNEKQLNSDIGTNGLKAMELVAKASGAGGMIGGQIIDISGIGALGNQIDTAKLSEIEKLDHMHMLKTGAIIKASVLVPAMIAGSDENRLSALAGFSESIGLAFQIKDDILDGDGYVALLGVDRSKTMLDSLISKASVFLYPFGENAGFLTQLAGYIANRSA